MKNAYYAFRKGSILLKKNKFLRAIMFLEKARDIEPGKASIREALAISYYNCGLYDSAKKNFEKALEIDASNDYAHYGLGLCLLKEMNIKLASAHLKIATFMKPDYYPYRKTLSLLKNISL